MTNLERWRLYMNGFSSPDCYIDFGFYYMVNACLQRRVWVGPSHAPCYPNMYVILTGEPAVGKGLVIKQVANVIKHHKMEDPKDFGSKNLPTTPVDIDTVGKLQVESVAKEDYENAIKHEAGNNPEDKKQVKLYEKPLKIPVAADATTYEALTRSMSRAYRRKAYTKYDEKLQKNVPASYGHSSLCFCLEEISSLFRKKTEDIVNFLLVAYDCGDYTYDTKTQGTDKIRKCCLNFFGGTTPNFMHSSFNDSLINEGFSSRCFFIFASCNRIRPLWIPELTEEQKQCYEEILAHTSKLTNLYGHVDFTEEANTFLENWWNEFQQGNRPNTNVKLNPYYGRKKVHVLKMAMAIHFGESTEMIIGIDSAKRALEVLAEQEKKMHYCLGLDRTNPLANATDKVYKYIENLRGKTVSFKPLLAEFWQILPGPDFQNNLSLILDHLRETGQINEKLETVGGGQQKVYYVIKQSSI